MDDFCAFFDEAAEQASNDNMDLNSLSGMVNVETFVMSKVVDAMKEEGVSADNLGSDCDAQNDSLQLLIERHRENVNHLFRTAGLGYLVDKPIHTWRVEEETGNFALFDGIPHRNAVRITALPCEVCVTCIPESQVLLERFLRAAAFEAHVYALARDLVRRESLRAVIIDVGDRVVGLREWLREQHHDLLLEVQNFLLLVPDVNSC